MGKLDRNGAQVKVWKEIITPNDTAPAQLPVL